MCDSWTSKIFEPLPSSIGQLTRSEINLLLVTIITCLHWSCVFSLFNQRRWKYKYLSNIITTTLITLLPLATITRDSTAVFLQFLPIVIDIYILATVIIDYACERKPRFMSATQWHDRGGISRRTKPLEQSADDILEYPAFFLCRGCQRAQRYASIHLENRERKMKQSTYT